MAAADHGKTATQRYRIERIRTASSTGFFACVPADEAGFDTFLTALRARPMDDFLHLHLLRALAQWDRERLACALDVTPDDDPVFQALLLEAASTYESFAGLADRIPPLRRQALAAHTPLIDLRAARLSDQDRHRAWIDLLAANIFQHAPLPRTLPQSPDLPSGPQKTKRVTFETLFRKFKGKPGKDPRSDPHALAATGRLALERLENAGIALGTEMRHEASLSPIALLRSWQLAVSVDQGRHRFRLEGEQTAYGRGIGLEAARAALAMEMVERVSAYAVVENERLVGLKHAPPLEQAPFQELCRREVRALNPEALSLEVPYQNQALVWMPGVEATGDGDLAARIPVQCVFLFANFDEPALFSALGSTGLAAGNTMAEARLGALLEIIERHCDAVTPFDSRGCFTLGANDRFLASLLADYRARGIHLQFQDIGRRFGLPCYRAFVIAPDGSVVRGTGAHLRGARAAVAAMTETPYPYPGGPPSRPGLQGLPVRRAERLPALSSGSAATDLKRVESLIRANGFRIFYADLTRSDLDLPVVRAVVPGLEILADFDRYSRLHPEAFFNVKNAVRP